MHIGHILLLLLMRTAGAPPTEHYQLVQFITRMHCLNTVCFVNHATYTLLGPCRHHDVFIEMYQQHVIITAGFHVHC